MFSRAPRQIFNERCAAARSLQGGWERLAARLKKQRGPEPCGVRASAKSAWEVRAYAPPPPGSHGSRWSCAARHGSLRRAEHKATRTSARPGAGRLLMGVAAAFTFNPGEKLNRWKWDAGKTAMELTVKSLYFAVNSCVENFCASVQRLPSPAQRRPPRTQGNSSPWGRDANAIAPWKAEAKWLRGCAAVTMAKACHQQGFLCVRGLGGSGLRRPSCTPRDMRHRLRP